MIYRKPLSTDGTASRWAVRRQMIKYSLIDLFFLVTSVVLSFALSYDLQVPVSAWRVITLYAVAIASAALVLFYLRRVYFVNARYVGLYDSLNIAYITFGLSLLFLVGLYVMPPDPLPSLRWLPAALFCFLGLVATGGRRILERVMHWRTISREENRQGVRKKRTLIVGAGDAGEMLIREVARAHASNHLVLGFVDDDPAKRHLIIHGVQVIGTTEDIPTLVTELGVDEILIAMPAAHGTQMRRVIGLCSKTTAKVRTLPAVSSLLSERPQLFHQFRDVDIEDLLRREPVQTDMQSIAGYLSGERVMITGAGGSIGAELARQIADIAPASLILLGKGENSVYEIEQELLQTKSHQPVSIIADVRDRQSMEYAFDAHCPSVVFHAAAHKHVPLMQSNPIEAIKNNVRGTWLTAELSARYGVKRMILVSTDKAVNPTSIMGATKRVGELIVSSLAQRSETTFAIVRFGNVMGSRGSFIPMLKEQIKRGGPVRITHPDMTRYFMTIREAVQLIVQAGALGQKGEVFILDMGEPIRIADLANDVIRLHGLVPGQDIEINYTGVRPGEKIHEELAYAQEELCPSAHEKISVVRNNHAPDWDWLKEQLQALMELCEQGKQEAAKQFLMELAWGKTIPPFEKAVVQPAVPIKPEVK